MGADNFSRGFNGCVIFPEKVVTDGNMQPSMLLPPQIAWIEPHGHAKRLDSFARPPGKHEGRAETLVSNCVVWIYYERLPRLDQRAIIVSPNESRGTNATMGKGVHRIERDRLLRNR